MGYDNKVTPTIDNVSESFPTLDETDRIFVRNQVVLQPGTHFTISEALYQNGTQWVAGDVGNRPNPTINIAASGTTPTALFLQ